MTTANSRNHLQLKAYANPFVESFNARLRDEQLFNREIFHSVFDAKVFYFDWCDVYNNFRPHSSISVTSEGVLPSPTV